MGRPMLCLPARSDLQPEGCLLAVPTLGPIGTSILLMTGKFNGLYYWQV